MRKAIQKSYEQMADALRFYVDYNNSVIYGVRNGYDVMLYPEDMRYPNMFTVSISAKNPTGEVFGNKENKQFFKEFKDFLKQQGNEHLSKKLIYVQQGNNLVTMREKSVSNIEKEKQNMDSLLNYLTDFLRSKGYAPCCQKCGQSVETTDYIVGSSYMHLCSDCFNRMSQDTTFSMEERNNKKENLIGGIVGALLGSVIGIICIIFFSQLGRVAAVSGVVMAVCTVKGYELLGGKLTKKGIVISCIMMIVMTYIGDRLDWALMIVREVGKEWEIDFATAYNIFPEMLSEGYIESANYYGNLVLLYLFTVLGAAPTISGILKERKNDGRIERIGTANLDM